jgi:hypothetical protein
MSPAISVFLLLRDLEPTVARLVRSANVAAASIGAECEILALDERSGDNTLSVLSLLHRTIPALRTFQDLPRGGALQEGARVARGAVWLILDHPVEDPELMRWALREVLEHGKAAAIVPGEVLAIDAATGATVLAALRGGLVSAQRAVAAALVNQGTLARRPAPDQGLAGRALLFVRGRLGRLGLPHLDRPIG